MISRRSGLDLHRPAPGEPIRCLLFPNTELAQQMSMWKFYGAQRRFYRSAQQPRLAIDVDHDEIRVFDANSNAPIAAASLAQVTAIPETYRWRALPPPLQGLPAVARPGAALWFAAQFTSIRYGERLAEIGAVPSIGTVGDSFDNALAETVNGYYKAELIYAPPDPGRGKPSKTSSWLLSGGWTGTTPAACTAISTTCHQQSSKPRSTLRTGPTTHRSKSNSRADALRQSQQRGKQADGRDDHRVFS